MDKQNELLNVQQAVFQLQYCQRHSVINHCDKRITLLSDTDISFGLLNLFTYFDMRLGW